MNAFYMWDLLAKIKMIFLLLQLEGLILHICHIA